MQDLVTKYDKIFIVEDFNVPEIKWSFKVPCSCSKAAELLVDLLINSHLEQIVDQPTR